MLKTKISEKTLDGSKLSVGLSNKPTKPARLREQINEKGMATIETLPILIIFLILFTYVFGSFGAIHTGILHSIAARNYAFSTFTHRPNLTYFRSNDHSNLGENYEMSQVRYHGVKNKNTASADYRWVASAQSLSQVGIKLGEEDSDKASVHNNDVHTISPREETEVKVSKVWIKVVYGICINAFCGD